MSHLSNAKTKDETTQTTESLKSAVGSSPRNLKSTGGEYNQTDLREPIAEEMASEILECPIDNFLNHYAPFVPSKESIDNALQALKDDQRTDRLLEEVDDGDKRIWTWASFGQSPVKPDAHEVKVFRDLQEIADFLGTVECRERNDTGGPRSDPRNREFSYKDCPSTTIKSEILGTNFRVDACITSNPRSKDIVLSDTAVVAEFKKDTNAAKVNDNRLKLVSAASHMLNDDPCRTWVYGITIEGTQMSVWYFCRSHSVKSESFDFTKDIEKFIQVFLSFLYATRKEIGYDPTVHRALHDNKICYVYEMGTEEEPRYFRTMRLLFTPRVLCITGRKTRVWEAIEVEGYSGDKLETEKGQPVALKDGWLDGGSRTEGDIQAEIFARLEGVRDTDYQWAPDHLQRILDGALKNRKYKEYFMEILSSRTIATTKTRSEHAKPKRSILSPPPPALADSKKNVVPNSAQNKDRSGLPSSSRSAISQKPKKHFPPREYRAKQQHRLIYSNVGCPLHDAEDIKTSFLAIKDTCIALVLMYLAGWTHRDVSTGNIIVIKRNDEWRGKLSDLEYAKEFDSTSRSSDPKTGTPFFMPLEIHGSKRFYTRPVPRPRFIGEGDVFGPEEKGADPYVSLPPKFRFQHDLESLWWISLWILLYRVKHPKALEVAGDVFTYGEVPTEERTELFTNEGFATYLKSILPQELSSVATGLDNVRAMLHFSYVDETFSGNKAMTKPASYCEIYRIVWGGFSTLVARAQTISFNFDDLTFRANDTNDMVLQKRPRPMPKLRDDDEYEPVVDSDEEQDSDQTGDDIDEPEAKRSKHVVELRRRQIGS